MGDSRGSANGDRVVVVKSSMRALALTLAVTVIGSRAEDPRIMIGEDRLLSIGSTFPIVEPHLTVNPRDRDELLVGASVIITQDLSDYRCASWHSRDGGQSWTHFDLSISKCSDPWPEYLPDGTALFAMNGFNPAGVHDTFVMRSPDGGATWPSPGVSFGRGHDHPMLVADSKHVYLATGHSYRNSDNRRRAEVFVASSIDGGTMFAAPTRVLASNLSYEAETPVILRDGTLLVPFGDHHRWDNPQWLNRPREWLLRSSDNGRNFSEPLFISDACEGQGGWSSMVANRDDHLFWLCIAEKFAGVILQKSEDRGETWTDPKRISHQQGPDSHTPAIAISGDGMIGVSWFERHDQTCLHTCFTVSLDDGKTFVPDVRVSSATSCPDTAQNQGAFKRWFAGGDCSGLAATGSGQFQLVWADARTGIYQLRTAKNRYKAIGTSWQW
jgi:hypothetical protein